MTLPSELRTAIHVLSDGAMGGSPTPSNAHLHEAHLMRAWSAAIPADLEARYEAQARQWVAQQSSAAKRPEPPPEPAPTEPLGGVLRRLRRLVLRWGDGK